ncbi:Nucleotidylyl transferase [Trichodelitschia bisporula]|uniref:Tryptophan--tRNA ligase, mitochondrial n=1 Tax=Trichodelitschia bisporula TaxID=703511 RepID=A0A6G1I970_9PEZI|nr:Nucleotidylyl transferase [Trichodelitschia bisporula]
MLPLTTRRAASKASTRYLRHASSSSVGAPSPSRKVIFSGIQPTGVPHLGNYLGALQAWVKLQNEAAPDTKLIYSLVDLHAITVAQSPELLRQHKRQSLAALLAIGLDPERSIIFVQSDVPQHSELMWILSCTASMGYLSRMTQWKSKLNLAPNAKPLESPLQLGLFSYPVLQAADILIHGATHVPVGEDQCQHLELTRTLALGFNERYGPVLTEPETVLSPTKRIMSLVQPDKKMSKSATNPKSRILITDSPDEVTKKIKGALTDSIGGPHTFDPVARPGLANILQLLHSLDHRRIATVEDLTQEFKDVSMKALKDMLADAINKHLEPIRTRYLDLTGGTQAGELDRVAEEGALKARASAEIVMADVRRVVGLSR